MKTLLAAILLAPLLLTAILITGCDEVKPAAESPTITPPSATISKGQSIAFSASDGFDYHWSLSSPTLGILSAVDGPTTVYTSLQNSGGIDSGTVQALTLTSRIIGAQGGTSNETSYARTAEAFIRHLTLAVSPTTVSSLSIGRSVALRATDGTVYTWSLRFPDWGTLSTTSGQETTYTSRYDPGKSNTVNQVVIVRSFDNEALVTITHTH